PENLCLTIQDQIITRLRSRASSYDAIAHSISALVNEKKGNYLIYFPSYDFLKQVLDRFRASYPEHRTEAQIPGMTETEREEFIGRFQAEGTATFIAFAVLGGIFGEGIDLVGDRLIGVAIVGVGLPQLGLERDLIREYWQEGGCSGFDYAYTYPGMNRVLQAVGRLICSDKD